MENKMKSLSTTELQSIISKALSSSLKEELNVSISSIEYGESFSTGATFKVAVWKDNEFMKTMLEKKK